MATGAYSVLYKIQCRLYNNTYSQSISPSDIVSVSIIHNYDVAMYPVIRVRLYTDLSVMEGLTADPDNIYMDLSLMGSTCNMNYKNENDNGAVQVVDGASSYDVRLKSYIEHKNTPTSMMDQYDHGIKKDGSLNTNNKIPVTVFGYNGDMINSLRQRAPGVFKNMSISSIIKSLTTSPDYILDMDDVWNNTKYDQVLVPNLNIKQAIKYFEDEFNLFAKGALLYGEGDILYLVDTDVDNNTTPIPIYVE